MSDALPNESAPASQTPATPTWIWGVVGAVVLIALAAGAYAGYQAGYDSTVIALKANEAVMKGQKVSFTKELFTLA